MQLSPSIFKAYDIRGVVPTTLTEEVAYALGRAFGAVALREGEATVAVGRDGRLSGPGLSAALVRGDIKLARPMKIVVDSGNGIAGASAPAILRAIGCEVIELFSAVDGNFPNHHPDPSKPENLRDLIQALRDTGAELGLAFDGDGDRLGIVTREGNNIYPDRQMMLFARDVLTRVPGGTILFDVKCSQRLAPAIEAAGGVALMYKTGHSLIKAKMKAIEAEGKAAPLGGEMSGHIFFKERWYGFDDGTYAGCRLLEIVSRSPDASAVLDSLPTSFSTPELNVRCAEGEPHRVTDALQKVAAGALAAAATAQGRDPALAHINTIDGLRVDWPDGFGLVRGSNTTPVLVLRFEGHTQEAMHRIEADMLALLRSVKPEAPGGKRYALANQTEGSSYERPTRWVADVAVAVPPHIHAVQRSRVLCAQALGYAVPAALHFGLAAQGDGDSDGVGAGRCVALVHGTSRDDKLLARRPLAGFGPPADRAGLHAGPAARQRRRAGPQRAHGPARSGPRRRCGRGWTWARWPTGWPPARAWSAWTAA
jgi:phosphomannomutase